MKYLMINVVCGIGSTGRICTDLAVELERQGNEVKIAYGRGNVPEKFQKYAIRIGTEKDVISHFLKARLLDDAGFGSKRATKRFIEWVKEFDPDVIHLHNLHGYYLNIEELFRYLKKSGKKVIWTLHDCWAFTGRCTYFSYIGCDRWQTGCWQCPQKQEYPKSVWLDKSKIHWQEKKEYFTGIDNMLILTPSQWLADLVEKSFLKEYPIEVKYNTIDKTIFKYTYSDFKKKHNIEDKKMILGVASVWDKRKGLNDFLELAKMIQKEYIIVLVGVSKKQKEFIEKKYANILCIQHTENIEELVKIYSAADVFVNPSREETFGMTTVEALSCGTCAIVYKDTACEEIAKKYGGIVCEPSVRDIYKNLLRINGEK